MRRSSRHKKLNSRKPLAIHWLGLIVILVFAFLAFTFFKVITLPKFIYLNRTEVGDAEIIIIDSQNDSIIKYLIPNETELEASGGYGSYKLSSLWILSEKDDLKGKLVVETVTKNYSLPVYYWKDEGRSNLSIYQKIKASLVSKQNINYEAKITNKKISDSILINFVNDKFLENNLKIEIEDLTGTQNVIDKVSKIIEVLGGKVSNNSKGYDEELDCEVVGKDIELLKLVNNIFNCSINVDNSAGYDLKIRLGAKFTERF